MKRVLVACECSGTVRDAFRSRGYDAWSCDIIDSDEPSEYHIKGDALDQFQFGWDLIIAHPPCTYLCNSGVRWLSTDPTRWAKMKDGAEFFKKFLDTGCPRICIENPIMHKHAKAIIGVDYTQIVQPWQFGHGETKATCLWLQNLPPLQPTNIVEGREGRIHKLPPSKDRGKLRSVTYQGIADAMAEQWGPLI